jgi:hypothetical protein
VFAQPQPQPVVYDQMAKEICNCIQASKKVTIVKRLDACYLLALKKNYAALRQLGIDTSKQNDKMELGRHISDDLKNDCPDTYNQYVTALMATSTPVDSAAPSFTGKLVSQKLTVGKKYYLLILKAGDNGETREFYTPMKVTIHPYALDNEVTVRYKIVTNKNTKKTRYIVLSTEITEKVPAEYKDHL